MILSYFGGRFLLKSVNLFFVRLVNLFPVLFFVNYLFFLCNPFLAFAKHYAVQTQDEGLIGNHYPIYDFNGRLRAWEKIETILDLEMKWYLNTPVEFEYPRYFWMTFMDGNYSPLKERSDFIPATQNGMGIISYLKYYRYILYHTRRLSANSSSQRITSEPGIFPIFNFLRFSNSTSFLDPELFLNTARKMGHYLIKETFTPNEGAYPLFPHSTGTQGQFPLPPNSGSQNDLPYEVQPDKGGIVGYALILLSKEDRIPIEERGRFLFSALHIARTLAKHQEKGTRSKSPWPFRVDFRTGEARGPVSGNMIFILRLYDELIGLGFDEFVILRNQLWQWIFEVQVPSALGDGLLWVQFFEDHDSESNRTAWSPLNTVRYLLEKKEQLHPRWMELSKTLIDFVQNHFLSTYKGILVCGEQDHDLNPWGGILSTWSAVLAMYAKETHEEHLQVIAHQGLILTLYAVDEDGSPRDLVWNKERGGWQEDAHTDVIHNVIDAINAFPEWAKGND